MTLEVLNKQMCGPTELKVQFCTVLDLMSFQVSSLIDGILLDSGLGMESAGTPVDQLCSTHRL